VNIIRQAWSLSVIPIVSILLALLVGSIIIIASSPASQGALDLLLPLTAYESLLEGATGFSFLDVDDGVKTFAVSIDGERAIRSLTNTLAAAGPLVLTGLAVGVGFKAGLFNIGGTGQVLVGGFAAALAGAAVADQPGPVAVTVAILAGAIGGGIYGFIPGALKALTGAHEVVVTIMLNSLAAFAIVGLVNDVFKIQGPSFSRTAGVGNATLPVYFEQDGIFSILLAIAIVIVTYVLIYRTTIGFEIRTVGANPSAARYAGRDHRDPRARLLPCGLRHVDRLRRDHGSPAGPSPSGRHPAGRAAPGRDARGRPVDADHRRHPDRDHRRHPGPDPAVPRR